jgi:hypothetical protein
MLKNRVILSAMLILLAFSLVNTASKLKTNIKAKTQMRNTTNETTPINTTAVETSNTTTTNKTESISPIKNAEFIYSSLIQAYEYVDYKGVVYDISELNDKENDYTFYVDDAHYYFNIGKFAVSQCKRKNSYFIYHNSSNSDNNTNCIHLSGTDQTEPTIMRIISKILYLIKRKSQEKY